MASIRSSIELFDNFSAPMNNIINAANAGAAALSNVESAMNQQVNISGLQAVQTQAAQTQAAVQSLSDTLNNVTSPSISYQTNPVSVDAGQKALTVAVTPQVAQQVTAADMGIPDNLTVSVTPEVIGQVQLDTPDSVTVAVTPQVAQQVTAADMGIPTMETVQVNAVTQTAEQQITKIQSGLDGIKSLQGSINTVASNVFILSDDAKGEVQDVNREIQRMQAALNFLRNNPFDLNSEFAQMQMNSLYQSISEVTAKQQELNTLMNEMPSRIAPISEAQPNAPNLGAQQQTIHWQLDNLDVFTNTGIERFQQEVQSANEMLNTLNLSQQQLTATAASVEIIPSSGIADMQNIQNRIAVIQQRVQALAANPLNFGTDSANAGFEQLRMQLSQVLVQQQNVNTAMANMDASSANAAYLQLSQSVGNMERYIRDNTTAQGEFNAAIEQGANNTDALMNKIKAAVGAYVGIQSISKIVNLSDQQTSTNARLSLMVDDNNTVEMLQQKIYASAQNSRASYQSVADAVSKMGLMAGDAFSSNNEIISFMEQVNKQFAIAGTEAAGVDAAMLQLTQAMGSGVLRGEEYNSILEQAPNIIQTIADYMNVPKGELKDMAADGQITADIVKAAMLSAADETNAKFESMPMTFEQIGQSFENTALLAFQPVLDHLNDFANSAAFQNFVNSAINDLAVLADMAVSVFDVIAAGASFIGENWSIISPIIMGVAGALGVYYGAQMAANAVDAISNGLHVAIAAAQMMHAAAIGTLTSATAAQIAAQNGLNTALYACPIVWVIAAVVALVALFYAAIAAVNQFAGTSISATGVIAGAFMAVLALIGNLFVAFGNIALGVFVSLYNLIATFVNFFATVFDNPVAAIANLFSGLFDFILDIVETIASAIDTVFGSNLSGAVADFRGTVQGWTQDTFGSNNEVLEKINFEDVKLDRFSYGSAYSAGYDWGPNLFNGASALTDAANANYAVDPSAYSNLANIADNTKAISDSVAITEDEMMYMRDIAEREAINRYTTAEIKIEQNNNNNISKDIDAREVMEIWANEYAEALNIEAEGVYP